MSAWSCATALAQTCLGAGRPEYQTRPRQEEQWLDR